jgi:hypothetical protein
VSPTIAPLDLESAATYSDFVEQMEELGLFANLEDQLPSGFTAVYEIGRILARGEEGLGKELAPLMTLAPSLDAPEAPAPTEADAQIVEVPAGEEYEAEYIRSWSDVRYLYSWQWLLPEEAFIRRLAERTLWFPMAKAPRIRAIESGDDDFSPSPSKQKVYVLLDTSKSMALHHRFALAKAAVIRFLRHNQRELGEITFRTFDVDVGERRTANDRQSYEALIRRIARQSTLGNGTCLEKAILTACEDIHEQRTLSGAEILLVTDGAARVAPGDVQAALGDRIRLHCLKLGHAHVYATDQWIHDRLELDTSTTTRRSQRIVQLRERRRHLQRGLRNAVDDDMREGIRYELRRIEFEQGEIGKELKKSYGHEIERISHLYIEIDDINAKEAFALTDEQLDALKNLVQRLLQELEASPAPADAMKKAAMVMSHLAMLASEQNDPVAKEFLEKLRTAIEQRLEQAMESHEEHILEGGLLTPSDQRDLRILLHGGSKRGSSLWVILLRYFYRTFSKVLRRDG